MKLIYVGFFPSLCQGYTYCQFYIYCNNKSLQDMHSLNTHLFLGMNMRLWAVVCACEYAPRMCTSMCAASVWPHTHIPRIVLSNGAINNYLYFYAYPTCFSPCTPLSGRSLAKEYLYNKSCQRYPFMNLKYSVIF